MDRVQSEVESSNYLWSVLASVWFRSGKIIVRVDPCNDLTSCLITRSTESEVVSFNCDGLPMISLEQACGWQEPDIDARCQICWDLNHSKVAQGILHCPQHMTLVFNLQSFCNALQLSDGARGVDLSDKVFAIQGNWNACARVPNDWERCSLG